MAAKLTPEQLRMVADSKGAQSAFHASWKGIGLGGTAEWGKAGFTKASKRKVAFGQSIRLELTIRADPKFQAFLKRLDHMPAEMKKQYKRILRGAVQREIIPRLRKNIPVSDDRKKHLRSTAAIMSVDLNRAIVGVGGSKHFYAAIVHAGRSGGRKGTVPAVPFFPMTFKKAWHPLNKRLIKEMAGMLEWLATGRKPRRFR